MQINLLVILNLNTITVAVHSGLLHSPALLTNCAQVIKQN